MFEAFSRGYYLGRLYVEPHDGERAVMEQRQHERVNEQLYASGEGVEGLATPPGEPGERVDYPLVMKLDEAHLAVHGDPDVPADTLAVPAALLERTRVRNPPALREVLLAKGDRAAQLLGLVGWT